MSVKILMPALSPTMEKGNLAKWLKQEGDTIKSGDIIAEIETDKATMEVEAVDEGVLAKIIVPEGTADVPVNEVIAVIAEEGEDVAAVAAAGAGAAPATAAASAPAAEAPPAQTAAAEAAPAPTAQSAAPAAAAASHGERIFASPLARRLAKEAGIDIAAIKGTGPHGRIIERDVQSAAKGGVAQQAAAPAAAAPAPATAPKPAPAAGAGDEAVKKLFAPDSYEELPNDNMRKTIARRLLESKQTVPHFYLSVDTELDALLALREQINAAAPKDKDGKPVYKVSVNDFVIKALALSLRQVPDANVSWTDAAILRHKAVDVGVAVAIPGGLITPVVRNADIKSISTISNEMKDFAARARARKLRPDEYQGGSTAVSNLGMFGIKNFSAIINPPHATILAVGAGEKRVVVKDGAPAVATVMTVTLSTDHRAVDGALGAELLAAFKPLIENPLGLLV
ncbi:pyruvate dehydrogenase complex dihydrolipoamide acetyltransferase [Pseudochelatococcus contaminans]|uniref:Acetyltransferase component of pyruvate dehydrogenase complex n=1 Tax=Pseudochelatococcus contaminans TaxID=1538103 RepID=A0A7W6EGA3_9HYPH|nr:pyruvate dehydrogenase complex dihydrolipoamide acetyltransferase [Pseudochelatococcus contaminans]MBB3809285.1 pyruvate dehydrogenase E2 component (dihydrolipoamide acetyltransferase) [Pseudochelatococcus contaminans]